MDFKIISKKVLIITAVFAVIVSMTLSVNYLIYAWTEPTSAPPVGGGSYTYGSLSCSVENINSMDPQTAAAKCAAVGKTCVNQTAGGVGTTQDCNADLTIWGRQVTCCKIN